MRTLIILLLTFLNILALEGKVIKVSDGDTITILTAQKEPVKIRLHGIDAPEKKQAYGEKSKQFLSSLIANKVVKIKVKGKDRYKRVIGIVYLNDDDINAKMVKNGYAHAFIKYSKDYLHLEGLAKEQKLNIWSNKNIITPWDFRKIQKQKKQQ